jgi:hypothetical protein
MAGELVYQTWQRITGKPWSAAAAGGFTNGSYEANIALQKRLLSGWNPYAPAAPAPAPAAPAPAPAATVIDKLVEAQAELARMQMEDYKKLFVDDPLAVDKALAEQSRQSAIEKYDPEYQKKLNEFVSDVGVNLNSFESKQKLIDELSGAKSGIAGASAREYQQAREAALQGYAQANTLFGGQRALGQAEVSRGYQVGTAAENLQREYQTFGDIRAESLEGLGKLGARRELLTGQIIPRYETYAQRYPGTNVASESLNVLNTFYPTLQQTQEQMGSYKVPELSRSFGL